MVAVSTRVLTLSSVALSLQTDDELREFIRRELRGSDLARGLQQLSGIGLGRPLSYLTGNGVGWGDYVAQTGDTTQPAARVSRIGSEVCFAGIVRSASGAYGFSTAAAKLFTLPDELLPAKNASVLAMVFDGSGNWSAARILVGGRAGGAGWLAPGEVGLANGVGGGSNTGAAPSLIFLDSVRYPLGVT